MDVGFSGAHNHGTPEPPKIPKIPKDVPKESLLTIKGVPGITLDRVDAGCGRKKPSQVGLLDG